MSGPDLADNSVKGEDIDLEVYRPVEITSESQAYAKTAEATCAPGYTVFDGGGRVSSSLYGDSIERAVDLTGSSPSSNGQGWRVTASVDGDDEPSKLFRLTAYAICARV